MIDIEKTLSPLIERVTDAVHSNFPSHHDKSDTASELWVWVYEKLNTVTALVRDSESWERQLYSTMTKVATTYLQKEDAAAYGYSQDDVFVYTTEVVEKLLEAALDYEDWQSFSTSFDGQRKGKAQANMTGDHLAMLVDVKAAIEKLSEKQYNAVVWRYKYNYSMEAIGAEEGVSRQAAEQRIKGAVESIRAYLGKKPLADLRGGYDGRRDPGGSAEARYQTERDYEG